MNKTQELQAAHDLLAALVGRKNSLRDESNELMAKQAMLHSERPRLTPEQAASAPIESGEVERTITDRRNAIGRLQIQVEQAVTEQQQRVTALEREASLELLRGEAGKPYRTALAALEKAVQQVASANAAALAEYRELRGKLPDGDKCPLVSFPPRFGTFDPQDDGHRVIERFSEHLQAAKAVLAA